MKRAMIICGALAFASGIWLITAATGLTLTTLAFLFIGLAAIGAAVKYTYGAKPYGYAGLGDVSVFLFFGIVGVMGTYYLHTGSVSVSVLLPAIAFGLLSTGVLNVNNMRDITNDAASGKRTIVVRLGARNAKVYHSFLILTAITCLAISFLRYMNLVWLVAFALGLSGFLLHLVSVWRADDPHMLDPQLKKLAMNTFFMALLLSVFIWTRIPFE